MIVSFKTSRFRGDYEFEAQALYDTTTLRDYYLAVGFSNDAVVSSYKKGLGNGT